MTSMWRRRKNPGSVTPTIVSIQTNPIRNEDRSVRAGWVYGSDMEDCFIIHNTAYIRSMLLAWASFSVLDRLYLNESTFCRHNHYWCNVSLTLLNKFYGTPDNKPKFFHKVNIRKCDLQNGSHTMTPWFIDKTTYNLAPRYFKTHDATLPIILNCMHRLNYLTNNCQLDW